MQIKFFASILLTGMAITGTGCANNNPATNTTGGADTTGAPVETKKPNSTYKPAFAGQTRTKGVRTSTPYTVDKLADDLESPWAIIALTDGRFLITERKGTMTIRDNNGKALKKITGIPVVDAGGQGGLLDVALDPDFAKNKIIFWSFSEKQSVGNLMAVAKGQLDEAAGTVKDPQVIFRATPALKSNLHFGSRLVFDKEGYLFVSTGERSILEGRAQAQLLTSGLGKIFRITKEGKPAPGNPFFTKGTNMPEIYAYGIRNAQGLAIHPVTGELWETEFGPRGGDEVNIIKAGKNYGWPVITYGLEYSGEPIGEPIQQKEGMEQPVYYWDPVLSPSGICFYNSDSIPEWKNNLFIGGLSSSHIARLVITDNKVTGEERLLSDLHLRFRDVLEYNGALYTITDDGKLYRVKRK